MKSFLVSSMLNEQMIVSLLFDEQSKIHFTTLRQMYFPVALNYLDAHLTLFHNIPDEPAIRKTLHEYSRIRSFEMLVSGLIHTGFGVAYKIESTELIALHTRLSQQLQDVLIPQDRQKFKPHITVQNKVTPAQSKILYESLSASFEPSKITAVGISLFEYKGGPWNHIEDYYFQTGN
ncbi:MAG: 2'-5' RNA ligase family protein [Flavitalea sp.]